MLYLKNLDGFLAIDIEPVIALNEAPSIAFGVIITERNGEYFVRSLGDENIMLFIPEDTIASAKIFKDYYLHDMAKRNRRDREFKPYIYEESLPMSKGERLVYGLFINHNRLTDHWYPNLVGDPTIVDDIPSECFCEAQAKFEQYIGN